MTVKTHYVAGKRFILHPLVTVTLWRIKRHPMPKKRRRWSVERYQAPGIWEIGDTLYVHPELLGLPEGFK